MKLEPFLSRARYLALVLPLFALMSTIHAGCTAGVRGAGIYGLLDDNNSKGSDDSTSGGSSTTCTVSSSGYVRYGTGADCTDGPGSGGGGGYGGR